MLDNAKKHMKAAILNICAQYMASWSLNGGFVVFLPSATTATNLGATARLAPNLRLYPLLPRPPSIKALGYADHPANFK